MTKTIPLAEAKKSLSAIIKDVDERFDRFAITKNGVEKAVIISSDEFDGLMETLDILSHTEDQITALKLPRRPQPITHHSLS